MAIAPPLKLTVPSVGPRLAAVAAGGGFDVQPARALSARLESQGIPSESRMGESPSVVPCHRFAFWGANAEAVFAGLAWTGD